MDKNINEYSCVCGKTFSSKSSLYGHYGSCKEYLGEERYIKNKNAHIGRTWKIDKPAWNRGLTKDTDERVQKISESLTGKPWKPSSEEVETIRREKLSKVAKEKHLGGYVFGSGIGQKGSYKGYWSDSSWELAYIIYNLDHDISFQRNTNGFLYKMPDGSEHFYYPDFVEGDYYIEIKGFEKTKDLYKYKAVPNLKVLKKKEMQPYLNYVIETYGENYVDLYE